MQIKALQAFVDNYIYILLDDALPKAAVVDPGDAIPVLEYLKSAGGQLTAILNTHHHRDHVGGNQRLLQHFPGIPVFGGAGDRGLIPGQTMFLEGNADLTLFSSRVQVLHVPGHTKAHIAYFFAAGDGVAGDLFSGDTVFGGTIGNMFEGSPEVMFESIRKIRALPKQTRIWCAHEYTLQYVRESAGLDPGNERLALRLKALEEAVPRAGPTIPLILEEECATNPFFRWDDPSLAAHLATEPGIATFRRLCEIT
jgi:hydroxyacylglutathione hydrolase